MHLKNQELITPIVQKPSDPVRAHRRRLQSPGPLAAGGTPVQPDKLKKARSKMLINC